MDSVSGTITHGYDDLDRLTSETTPQGSVNVTTDINGLLAQLVEYDPWGKISRDEGVGDSIRRFTGKRLDAESGLLHYGGRYYDPEFGRFISPDPFVVRPDGGGEEGRRGSGLHK